MNLLNLSQGNEHIIAISTKKRYIGIMKNKQYLFLTVLSLFGFFVHAYPAQELAISAGAASENQRQGSAELPLRRIALLSSGVGYFEHGGIISSSGETRISLPFDVEVVNDALQSLVLNDPASSSPSVRYAAANSLERSLQSLRVDLSGRPGIGDILNSLRGEMLEVFAPEAATGRIMGVENRGYPYTPSGEESWLSLFTGQGIRVIPLEEIISFRFLDEAINADLHRSLDLIIAGQNANSRNLIVNLDGRGSRPVRISYVIPAPVWKVSYRLDLSGDNPFLQGWAIVDNYSDVDWEGVELSLLTGRPVSFVQPLYPPYWFYRPIVPLSIAGIADSVTHDSGFRSRNDSVQVQAEAETMWMSRVAPAAAPVPMPMEMMDYNVRDQAAMGGVVTTGVVQTAEGRAAGDQFEFTLRSPVTLERRQSAMLPLVEGSLEAQKTLVFSGSRSQGNVSINPLISVELTNTSGMSLPAGPITVFDGGTYAGDALIEFLPENEKRLISYGEDLSVSGFSNSSGSRFVTGVTISGGVMIINRRMTHETVYTIRNASDEAKRLTIEHPITFGSELAEGQIPDERTGSLYRFIENMAPSDTLIFTVREETPVSERIVLGQLRPETFLSYSTNNEIPAHVRTALTRAVELRRTADNAEQNQRNLEAQRTRLVNEQDRIRRNLEAAGNQSPQGQEYLRTMTALDNEISGINAQIDQAARDTLNARRAYDDYIAGLEL